MRISRAATGVAVAASTLLLAAPAGAWPVPEVQATGGACAGSVRTAVSWTVTNLETAFPQSPAEIVDVEVTPAYPTTAFTPASLPNTGSATATATTTVPPGYSGTVTLTFTMAWSGPDGSDQRDGTASVVVMPCTPSDVTPTPLQEQQEPPSTTTTTVLEQTDLSPVIEQVPEDEPTAVADEYLEVTDPVDAQLVSQAVRPVAVQVMPQFTG